MESEKEGEPVIKHDEEYEPKHDVHTLKKKITYLEEELVRKDAAIEHLKKENDLLFKTAVKNSESKVKDKGIQP